MVYGLFVRLSLRLPHIKPQNINPEKTKDKPN